LLQPTCIQRRSTEQLLMALQPVLLLAVNVLLCTPIWSLAVQRPSPVVRVLDLLRELKTGIDKDASLEQSSYDKFECWCEDTIAKTAKDIANGQKQAETMQLLMEKLSGELGVLSAAIQQLKKDIAANIGSQKEATQVRDKETADYIREKTESEQCIGALEAAIKMLSGPGNSKGGFLETMNEAELLSVASGIRRVLQKGTVRKMVSQADLDAVSRFVTNPDDFTTQKTRDNAMLQLDQNPFGDYAPQSTQIQGILKGMYDSFTSSLEKANAEEGEKQSVFQELMSTKKAELQTLQVTLTTQQSQQAAKNKLMADTEAELDETKEQIKADEAFFQDTKGSCRQRAHEWSERSRLRSEELTGIENALYILSTESERIFENSSSTFLLQISSLEGGDSASVAVARAHVYKLMRQLARKYHVLRLAKIAAEVRTGGAFEKVMTMIDNMISLLRREEQVDIDHRDMCEAALSKNSADSEDMNDDINKAQAALKRMKNSKSELSNKIQKLDDGIMVTKQEMDDRRELRVEEEGNFKKALEADSKAVKLLSSAITALTKFYKKNRISLNLAQRGPEYTWDEKAPPEVAWDNGNYGGKKEPSKDIIVMLSMIAEKTENEMKVARKDNSLAQAAYEKDLAALGDVLHAQSETRVTIEKSLADLNELIDDKVEFKSNTDAEITTMKNELSNLGRDCGWVKTHFDSRRKERKVEIDGLQEAKSILAGAENGDYDELVVNNELSER